MPFTIDYKAELNTEQYEAATHLEGPQLVIAGAGSGKTRVLVHRVAYLVERGINPRSILLLTFTRKASREMMKRASEILDERCMDISGGTFHSFCNQILRRYAKKIGYSNNYTIADTSDSQDIVDIFRSALDPEKRKSRFPKKNTILNMISKMTNTGKSMNQILVEDYPQYEDAENDILDISKQYQKYKFQHSIMDYDDLLTQTVKLLKEHGEVREKLSNDYQYIMVDEYQDTNRVQAHIAALLAANHSNLMVVGDDAQSIYAFRGAYFKNIMDFPKIFNDCRITRLEQNYRSTQPILHFTNAIMEPAKEKYTKELYSDIKSKRKPVVLNPDGRDEEAEMICQKILSLREEGVDLADMAVLFRSSFHSNQLEITLNAYDIPYEKFGGIKFMEAAHIKDVMAIIRVALNPLDEISWRRILMLLEGIGKKTASNIATAVALGEAGLNSLIQKPFSGKKYSSGLEKLHQLMTDIQKAKTDPMDQFDLIMEYYRPVMHDHYDDQKKRSADLDSLSQIALKYKKAEDFLSDLTLDPPISQSDVTPEDKEDEKLTISTIHSAKGLEWHTVFVIHMVDGMLPSRQSLDNDENIEEERRLFYVAATRAKHNLWLMVPNMYMGDYHGFSTPSRFLQEMEFLEELIEMEHEEDSYENPEYTRRKQRGHMNDNLDAIDDFFS